MIKAKEAAKIKDAVLTETVNPQILKLLLKDIDAKVKGRSSSGNTNTAFYLTEYHQIYKHQYDSTIVVLKKKLGKLGYTVKRIGPSGLMVLW